VRVNIFSERAAIVILPLTDGIDAEKQIIQINACSGMLEAMRMVMPPMACGGRRIT
jgi:hypothetical protein